MKLSENRLSRFSLHVVLVRTSITSLFYLFLFFSEQGWGGGGGLSVFSLMVHTCVSSATATCSRPGGLAAGETDFQ